jgi:predicted DNA-binding protein (UPF0278 family)
MSEFMIWERQRKCKVRQENTSQKVLRTVRKTYRKSLRKGFLKKVRFVEITAFEGLAVLITNFQIREI